eukprot:CAMPEP_0175033340 /NCGR_PEP_ID=MMETSP0005-20121125/21939_1 /TAXON_ID=420556 /ORGANISM="Ochromonas sp., Strain CCMP1393" /LENGTH=142 /DNA_ID=CAMNT_0016293935 /DNA_START=1 /DNA_END=430 /DNA_ORIENTATION=-
MKREPTKMADGDDLEWHLGFQQRWISWLRKESKDALGEIFTNARREGVPGQIHQAHPQDDSRDFLQHPCPEHEVRRPVEGLREGSALGEHRLPAKPHAPQGVDGHRHVVVVHVALEYRGGHKHYYLALGAVLQVIPAPVQFL